MKLIRVLEYEGSEDWITRTMEKSLTGEFNLGTARITELSRMVVKQDEHWKPWFLPENK